MSNLVGMLQGPNFELYSRLRAGHPDVLFTVSGGISCIDDIIRLNDLGLPRVIVGKALYEGRITFDEMENLKCKIHSPFSNFPSPL